MAEPTRVVYQLVLHVVPEPTPTGPDEFRVRVGQPLQVQLAAKDGLPPLRWEAVELPPGVTLSPEGVLSAPPTLAAGTHVVAYRIVDQLG